MEREVGLGFSRLEFVGTVNKLGGAVTTLSEVIPLSHIAAEHLVAGILGANPCDW